MIFDLHNDLPTDSTFSQNAVSYVYDTVIYAFWTTELPNPLSTILNGLPKLRNAPFGVEDLWFADDNSLQAICLRRPYYCSLTHNQENSLAGGALSSGRLTAKGKKVIKTLNGFNITVDAAHLNRKSFYDTAEIASKFIVSHTGLDFVCKHPRNLTVDQVKTVLNKGGIIGLAAVKDFIGGDTAEYFVKSIDSFVQHFGTDGVCIGTDFYGTTPIKGLRGYPDFAAVANMLTALGYTYKDVSKIFYENAKNFFTGDK